MKNTTPLSFEQKMTEIEKIVLALEEKNIALEESLVLFEKGTALIRECQNTLEKTEQPISIVNNPSLNHENTD